MRCQHCTLYLHERNHCTYISLELQILLEYALFGTHSDHCSEDLLCCGEIKVTEIKACEMEPDFPGYESLTGEELNSGHVCLSSTATVLRRPSTMANREAICNFHLGLKLFKQGAV